MKRFVEETKIKNEPAEFDDILDSESDVIELSEISEDEEISELEFTEDDGEEERYKKFKIKKCNFVPLDL